jgi:hypothetical protein
VRQRTDSGTNGAFPPGWQGNRNANRIERHPVSCRKRIVSIEKIGYMLAEFKKRFGNRTGAQAAEK